MNALLQFMKFVFPTQKPIEGEDVSEADSNREYLLQLLEVPEENLISYMDLNDQYLQDGLTFTQRKHRI